ncbi:MAG: alcohol dehydrogenase catalytic domain-containing protein [Candidatus Competibacteraceae bacterium]
MNVPPIADDEVLVYVMAAGINNNVWAGLGIPVNVIGAATKPANPKTSTSAAATRSGIVYKVSKDVTNVQVGDEVVMHCGQYSRRLCLESGGGDPMYSPTFRIWGYETNWGSFARFTQGSGPAVKAPKPKHMNWEEAASSPWSRPPLNAAAGA